MKIKIYVLAIIFSFMGLPLYADTIFLKNGKQIEGLIVERSDSHITVEFNGVELKFYNDEIARIDPSSKEASADDNKAKALYKTAQLERLLAVAGTQEQLKQLSLRVCDEYSQHKEQIDPERYEAGSKIVVDAYRPDVLYQIVTEYFQNHFDQAHAIGVSDFLASPLAKKVSALDEKVAGSVPVTEIQKFADTLPSHPPSPERLALIKELDKAVAASDTQVVMTTALFKSIAQAIDPILPEDKRFAAGELEKTVDMMKTQLRLLLNERNIISISFLYTYQSLSDDELRQYIVFWNSPAGKWYNQITNDAFILALERAGQNAGRQCAALKEPIKTSSKTPSKEKIYDIQYNERNEVSAVKER
ncbi:MAG: hypothetical protein WCI77_06340 [Candidatus Omnitrophota bacterium]